MKDAEYSVLVMKGKHKGAIWYFDFANDAGLYPLINPKTKKSLTFFDWYLLWLDTSINEIQNNSKKICGYSDYIINT